MKRIVFLSIIAIMCISINTLAGSFIGPIWSDDFTYGYASSEPYQDQWDAAASMWKPVSGLSWSYESANSADVLCATIDNSAVTWDGVYNMYAIAPDYEYWARGELYINEHFIDRNSYSTTKIKQIAGHEFGHCLGLDEANTPLSLMYWYSGNRYANTPSSTDKSNVNSIY